MKNFSLETGECISGESYSLITFPVKVEDGEVYLQLEDQKNLEAKLGTEKFMVKSGDNCGPCGSSNKLDW
jgi:hypothetical protein